MLLNRILEGRQTLVMVGNRSSDGTHNTSKELYSCNNGKPEIVASLGALPCPPICGGMGKNKADNGRVFGSATLLDRGEKGMSII